MKEIQEAARTIPVMAETEVLVVGSGPGGLAAALASARQGAETMLMERFGCFGGNITQAGVESIAWYRHPQTIEAGGIGMEFEQRAVEMNAAAPEECARLKKRVLDWYRITSEAFPDEWQPFTPEFIKKLQALGYIHDEDR